MLPCRVLGGMNPPLRRRGQQQVAQTPEVGVCGLSYHGSGDEPQTGKARSALPELQEPLTPGPSPAKGRGESRLELIALSPRVDLELIALSPLWERVARSAG